ncbi:MAG TPA: PAS domain S-box protein [Blastocatellia bacterium]|nr:PAS domain S-box protein [Blastocatellia bacterium]
MDDKRKTKAQLISELEELRRRVAQMEHAEHPQTNHHPPISKIIETALEAIWMVDAQANTTYVNQHLAEMLGYTTEEMVGRSVFDFVDKADRLEAGQYLERGKSGIKEQRDFRFRRRDGSELWTMVSTTPLFDGEGVFVGGLAMLIDITERKRTERALKESEARLEAAIENLPFELWARDKDGRCIIQNPYSILQWGDFIGTLPEDIAPDSETLALWKTINRRAYAGEVVKGESKITEGEQAGHYYHVTGPICVDGEVRGILGVNIDITERRRAEEALRQSEAKFRLLAQTVPSAIVIFQDSKLVYVNSHSESHTGYSEQELLSMDFWEMVHPDHRQMAKERGLARLRGERVPSRYELKLITKSGEERWVDFAAASMKFEGKPAVLGTAFDITERKLAEEALRETQERLQHVLLCSPTTIYVRRIETEHFTAEWVSEGVTRLTGYEQSEALCEGWWADHLHPEDRERVLACLPRLLTDNHLVLEYRFEHKHGGYLWVHDESRLLRDESGKPVETIGSWTDVTERREAEGALRDSEERFRTLVGSMDDIVFTLDRHQRHTGVFGRWIERFGIEREVFIGKTASEIHGVEAAHIDDGAIARALKGEQVVYEWSMANDQGAFHFQTSLSPIRDQTGAVTGLVGVGRDVTASKQADEALRASEERYRDLVENAQDIIYTHDLKGNYTSVNQAVERITGYTREEALALNFEQSVAPEYLETARKMIAAKLAGQKETVYDLEIIAKDGRRITVEVNTRLVLQDGVPIGIQGIARDVTERKRAEEALRQSEERFRRYFELGLIGMSITSPAKGFIEVNDKMCEILGYERTELLQLTWAELTHADDLAANIASFERALSGESEGYSMDKRFIRKDGGVINATISVSCVRRSDRSVDYFIALLEDVTERKRAEEALRESRSRLRAILDNCPSMIFLKDSDGRYLQVNRQFELTFNLTPQQVFMKTDAELFPPQLAAAFRATDRSVLEAGHSLEFEESAAYANGLHTYIVHKFPLLDAAGKAYAVGGISTDITERKRTEDDLGKQKEILQSIFDHVPVMIGFFGADGRPKLLNREWERWRGWTLEEIRKQNVDLLADGYPDPQYRQKVLDFFATSNGEWADLKTKVRDGRAVEATWAIVHLSDGNSIGIGQDITERKRVDQLLRRQTAQLAALHEIELEISAESELSRVLDVITRRASELLNAYHCSAYIRDREQGDLNLVASLDAEVIGLRLKEGEGLAGRVAVSGAEAIDDYGAWEGRTSTLEAKDFGPVLGAPLKWQQTVIGAICLARRRGEERFTDDDIRFMEQIAGDAAIAIHQATLLEEVKQGQQRLQVLSHRLIDAQEAERKRLSRELHDQIGQALTAVQISLQSLQSSPATSVPDDRLSETLTLIDDALEQVHDLSLDLRPSLLDDLGLVAALRWYVDRVASRTGLVRRFEADVLEERLAPQIETACFRIAQEALTNVLRHAHAATVRVQVKHLKSGLQLVVQDDGVGFDVRAALSQTGVNTSLGLQGMQERAAALGGIVDIKSQRGNGVEVLASFPLAQASSP